MPSIDPFSADSIIKAGNRKWRQRRGSGFNQKTPIKRLKRKMVQDPMDEAALFSDGAEDAGHVVLGVYGTEDWIISTVLRDRHLTGKSTAQQDGVWISDAAFDLLTWVASQPFVKYSFFGANNVVAHTADGGIVKVVAGRGKIDVEAYGDLNEVRGWMKYFDENFKKAENLIEWIYNSRGDDISVPLNYRPAIRSAYPWIDESYKELGDYIDEYIDSDASVLILIGPPGTGKTTFIKNLIHRRAANAKVAYDPAVMQGDSFFAGFIGDDSKFLIMEDADEFLRSREDGNSMMHKFLNVSDGLISAADKKLVFSTNLPNVGDIDSALMRTGRCFDVLQFRNLTRDEAKVVLADVGSTAELPDRNSIPLSELFSSQPSCKVFSRRKMGFTG